MKKLLALGAVLVIAAVIVASLTLSHRGGTNEFERQMALGRGYLEKNEATNAIASYTEALRLSPGSLDAHLNLAVAHLLAGHSREVIAQGERALSLDPSSAAAYYLMGCAYMRLNEAEKAVQSFQQSQKIDPAVTALDFQLGLAHARLGQFEGAARQFETVLQFEPTHPSAHYQLSQIYQRLGRADDAARELAEHQKILASKPAPGGPLAFERCKYTEARVAFVLEQPDSKGIPVRFTEATASAFGSIATKGRGPIAVLDYDHDGRNSLVAIISNSFCLLNNSNGQFSVMGASPTTFTNRYERCLVADLNNDRFEDVLLLGEQASHVFRFATNGQFREVTAAAGLKGLKARDGVLADLDFTGRLDLLGVAPGGTGLLVYRNLGNMYFMDKTRESGLPSAEAGISQVVVEDWNSEDVAGVIATRSAANPLFYSKQRAGSFVQTNAHWKPGPGSLIAVADLDNDLLPDLIVGNPHSLQMFRAGIAEPSSLALKVSECRRLLLADYDNDGWLDLIAYGNGIQIFRNLGQNGFVDATSALGFKEVGKIDFLVVADFEGDGDSDLIASTDSGLKYWRNDGGNANHQLKLQLVGNRSNASAIGARVELTASRWHAIRTLNELPFEVGIGKNSQVETLKTRWFDLATTIVDVPVQKQPFSVVELVLPTGSCPYLYAWDGSKFRFVTDILGAAPMGLPVSEKRFVDADPDEYLALGSEREFPARSNRYEVRITEELREVLYLDTAQLVVVDHPAGTWVAPTSKMLPGKPFVPHELLTLKPVATLRQGIRSDGCDVTASLAKQDGDVAQPVMIREPQLRGLAEPFSLTLDFGSLDVSKPLVLLLNGWLRFGGGMANIAGSVDPTLPFPFPTLEAQQADGSWIPVKTSVGVPAGKTKTILVDLDGKLPAGTQRLRLTAAFELYWDYAVICEKADASANVVAKLLPASAELRWRGYSLFEDLPHWLPLTPDYGRVEFTPPWRRTPSGWCTRYGAVDELIAARDNQLVLLNGGDEVALSFAAGQLPAKPAGFERDFFLYAVGWDKDADYHVGQGWRVEPLPFHGMDDQRYGQEPRPGGLDDRWITKYNTRWVGPMVLSKARAK